MASEVKINGDYSQNLGNPFKEFFAKKEKNVAIPTATSKVITFKVASDLEGRNAFTKQDNYSVNSSSCNEVLTDLLQQDYKIENTSSLSVSCEIVSVDMDLSYLEEMISDIKVKTKIKVTAEKNGQVIINNTIEDTMNKDLGSKGSDYGLTLILNLDFKNFTIEDKAQEIIENSVFKMLNNKLRKGL